MTINHVTLKVSKANFEALRSFYTSALEPLGYHEMMQMGDDLIAFGSNWPYFWLQALSEETHPVPTHVAFDASSQLFMAIQALSY